MSGIALNANVFKFSNQKIQNDLFQSKRKVQWFVACERFTASKAVHRLKVQVQKKTSCASGRKESQGSQSYYLQGGPQVKRIVESKTEGDSMVLQASLQCMPSVCVEGIYRVWDNIRTTKYMKQQETWRKTDCSTIIVTDFSTPLSTLDRK